MTRLDIDTTPSEPGHSRDSLWRKHWLLAPGILLQRNLRFPAKFGVTLLFFLIPLGMLLFIAERELDLKARTLQRERAGLDTLTHVVPLVRRLQHHRDLQAAPRGGERRARKSNAAESGSALDALHAHSDAIRELDGGDALTALENATTMALDAKGAGVVEAHDKAIAAAQRLVDTLMDNSALALDSDPASHYLASLAITDSTRLAEQLARLRGHGELALSSGHIPATEHDRMVRLANEVRNAVGRRQHVVERLRAYLPNSAAISDAEQGNMLALGFLDAVRDQLLGNAPKGSVRTFTDAGTRAVDAQFTLIDASISELNGILAGRLQKVEKERLTDIGMVAAGLALASYLMLAFYRVLGGGLHFVGQQVAHLASGDLTARPAPWGRDEVADSMHALRKSLVSLGDAVKTIQECSQEVSNAAGELSNGNEDLSQRTQRSAAALEQTTSALQHLSELVQRNVDAVTHADQLVRTLSEQSRESGAMVQAMVERVADVHAGSRKVAEIVDLIDGIAFQTNILALNASVEAARAGSAGRGFTIVAQEVRELSQRTASAAKDITTLIRETRSSVDQASELGSRVGDSVGNMVEAVQRTASLVNEVNRDSLNQARSVDEIVRAVVDVNDTVQQNAALVEELSSSAHMLTENGDALRAAVARFRIDASGHVHPADLAALHALLQGQRPTT